MSWQDYHAQPISLLPAAGLTESAWLGLVDGLGLLRTGETPPPEMGSPELALGAFFHPLAEPPVNVLQAAVLLLLRGKLDRQKVEFAARRVGGALYCRWFLNALGLVAENPLPDQ